MVMTETRESKIVIYQKGLDSKEDYGTVNLKNEKAELGDSALSENKPADLEHGRCIRDTYILPEAPNLHKHKEPYVSERFIKFTPSEKSTWLRSTYPNAFLILSVIAERARRVNGMPDGLLIGDAIIGRQEIGECCGLSEKQSRLAIQKLIEFNILKIVWNGKKNKNLQNRAIKRAIKGMVVNLCDSSIWDINPNEEGQQKGQQRANRGPTEGHKQEGIRKNKNEKEHHPPNPLHEKPQKFGDDDIVDDDDDSFFSKNDEKIHVHRDCSMTKQDFDDCVRARGGFEKVKLVIDQILDWDGRENEISNWKKTILKWSIKNNSGEVREKNESYGKQIENQFKNLKHSWEVRTYWCDIKDDFGLLFQLVQGAVSKQEFVSYRDVNFKEKVDGILIQKGFPVRKI